MYKKKYIDPEANLIPIKCVDIVTASEPDNPFKTEDDPAFDE